MNEHGSDRPGRRVPLRAAAIAMLLLGAPAFGQDTRPAGGPLVRELYVPFEDLQVILDGDRRRVFLDREEYEDLLRKAHVSPDKQAPIGAALVAAQYKGALEDSRALLTGVLTIDVLNPGLHAVPLELRGVGVRSANWGDGPAALGRNPDGAVTLFVTGKGQKKLTLELTAPLALTAAHQTLAFQLPTPSGTTLELTVPGDVEVKSGASVVSRTVLGQNASTRLELLPQRGPNTIVMSLNNVRLQKDRTVTARSVQVAELTQGYQRLHATVSLDVLHGVSDTFRFIVPEGFEVTEVATPLLAQWQVKPEKRELELKLREPVAGALVVNVTALQSGPPRGGWQFPRLESLEVRGQQAVLGLLVEDRLQVDSIASKSLLPVDVDFLTAALPASIFRAEPGAPTLRPIASWYAAEPAFELSANLSRPEVKVAARSNMLVTLADAGLHVRGVFSLVPETEKLFQIEFRMPAEWQVTEVTDAEANPLVFESYREGQGTRIIVRLAAGVAPGQESAVYFQAKQAPQGWLGDWTQRTVEIPVFTVLGADRAPGALGVVALDDLEVRPENLAQLTPLDDAEKAEHGWADVRTNLAYRFELPDYRAVLALERRQPVMTARTFSFVQVGAGKLTGHYELLFDVQEARTRKLVFSLPADTPADLYVRGMDRVQVKEYVAVLADGRRQWTAMLGEPASGLIRLAVDFQMRLPGEEPKDYPLPIISAEGVEYQSGAIAVEGDADLQIELLTKARTIDVGELADAEYQLGRRLLGAAAFVGEPAEVKVSVFRRPGYGLPAAITQRAALASVVTRSGVSQTVARYQLKTDAALLTVQLPDGAELWSVVVDGVPAAPQRSDKSLLVSLPGGSAGAVREVHLVYAQSAGDIGLWGSIRLAAPRLWLRLDKAGTPVPVPTADLSWTLHAPPGYRVTRTGGTVFTERAERRPLPITVAGKALFYLAGGAPMWEATHAGLAKDSLRHEMEESLADLDAQLAESNRVTDGPSPGFDHEKTDGVEAPSLENVDSREGRRKAEEALSMPNTPTPPEVAAQVPVEAMKKPKKEDAAQRPTADPRSPPIGGGMLGRKSGQGRAGFSWALEGMRSLPIDITEAAPGMEFVSLGESPLLEATVVSDWRLGWLAWGVFGLVAVLGVAVTRRGRDAKLRYVFGIGLVSLLVPLVFVGFEDLAPAFDAAFYAVCLTAAWYLLHAAFGRGRACWRGACSAAPITAAVMVLCGMPPAAAGPPSASPAAGIEIEGPGVFIPGVRLPPVQVPADAIVVPYDPAAKEGRADAKRVLVPYDTYVELWNRAFPDKRLTEVVPPAAYALCGARFDAVLDNQEFLLVSGHIDIDVFTDKPVQVPLALAGGVLESASIGGQPARLESVAPPMQQQAQPHQNLQQGDVSERELLLLLLQGRRRHRLDVSIRLKLERRGGWRVALGRLPSAPATTLALRIPAAGSELRLAGVADRTNYETTRADQIIETALDADSPLKIEWRPRVAEGEIDAGLTVDSQALLDLRDDGVRLSWTAVLEFRRGQREQFRFRIPRGYDVDKVLGANIRGWELKGEAASRQLDVTMLAAARESETITVILSRQGRLGAEPLATFDAPVLVIDEARLHTGKLLIRRSPLVDVRTGELHAVSRADLPDAMPTPVGLDEPLLPVKAFQAWQFHSVPFRVELIAAVQPERNFVNVRSQVLVSDREVRLASALEVTPQGRRPVYSVAVLLPAGFRLDGLTAPPPFHWAVTQRDGRPLLTVYLSQGQTKGFPIALRGVLPAPVEGVCPLPQLDVLDMAQQSGQIAVQSPPRYEVRAVDAQGLNTLSLQNFYPWLSPEERKVLRLALAYSNANYSASLQLIARKARVSADTITNVRVTDRAVERTSLLLFNVTDAGVRELSFLLPAGQRDVRIRAPLLRQQTITPVDGQDRVRVALQFQDELLGQIRVLVEHDEVLKPGPVVTQLPIVEDGRTDRRYATLQNAGPDDVAVVEQGGLEELSRQSQQWRWLVDILDSASLNQVWLADESAADPQLVVEVRQRALLQTVQAKIGLAQTALVLDAAGAYRARQEYTVENTSEQFLEVMLPQGAWLWTSIVAGQPVKPTQRPDSDDLQVVRIPLVKTAVGDASYPVVLVYGGKLPELSGYRQVDFPLVHTLNIKAERSTVTLHVPDSHRWYRFDGTMRQMADQNDLTAVSLSYLNEQFARAREQLQSGGNPYAKVRAANNLRQLQQQAGDYAQFSDRSVANDVLSRELSELSSNTATVEQVYNESQAELTKGAELDNRARFKELVDGQSNGFAGNARGGRDSNFDQVRERNNRTEGRSESFNFQWFEKSQLAKPSSAAEDEGGAPLTRDGEARATGRPGKLGKGRIEIPQQQKQSEELRTRNVYRGDKEAQQDKKQIDDSRQSQQGQSIQQDEVNKALRYQQRLTVGNQPAYAGGGAGGPGQGEANAAQPGRPLASGSIPVEPPAEAASERDVNGVQLWAQNGAFSAASGAEFESDLGGLVALGLASLEVTIPQRGETFYFTTTRDDVHISATAIDDSDIIRWGRLLGLLSVVAIGRFVWQRWCDRFSLRSLFTPLGVAQLAVAGLVGVVFQVLPVLALVVLGAAIVLGIGLLVVTYRPAVLRTHGPSGRTPGVGRGHVDSSGAHTKSISSPSQSRGPR